MGRKVKGDDTIQYLVIVAKIDLDELARDASAEAMNAVDYEFEYDDDDELVLDADDNEIVTEQWFDETECTAELDEALKKLYGRGLVGGMVHQVTRGDYLVADASRKKDPKVRAALRSFIRNKLAIRT